VQILSDDISQAREDKRQEANNVPVDAKAVSDRYAYERNPVLVRFYELYCISIEENKNVEKGAETVEINQYLL